MANEQNLIPAKKGEVRNPNGRPKGIPNSATRMRRLLEITQNLKNPVTGEIEGFSVMEQLDMKLIQMARNGELRAIQEILNRLEGRPRESVDVTSQGEKIEPIVIYHPEKFKDKEKYET